MAQQNHPFTPNRSLSQFRAPSTSAGRTILPTPPATFFVVKEFEIYQEESNTFRADITVVENTPYVALSSWWFNRMSGAWLPTRKQIFLPKAAWFGLVRQVQAISDEISPIPDPRFRPASGMTWRKDSPLFFFDAAYRLFQVLQDLT